MLFFAFIGCITDKELNVHAIARTYYIAQAYVRVLGEEGVKES